MGIWVQEREENMPSNNSKYTPEFREETAKYIVESGKSASGVAEEIGIDKNTVCAWVREYRRKNGLPTYAEEKGIAPLRPAERTEENARIRALEKENSRLRKELAEEQEKVAIPKNPCTSLWNRKNEVRGNLYLQLRAFRAKDVQRIGAERKELFSVAEALAGPSSKSRG